MSTLDSILAYKAQKDAQARADIDAIPQGIAAFTAAKQAAQKSALDQLTLNVSAATHGLKIDPRTGGISRDESLKSPLDTILEQGKLFDARKNILFGGGGDIFGGNVPKLYGSQSQTVPTSVGGGNVKPSTTTESESQPNEDDLFYTETNLFGVPEKQVSESGKLREGEIDATIGGMKEAEKENIKAANNAKQSSASFTTFAKKFQLSQSELINELGPRIGQSGAMAYGLRQFAKVKSELGELPETKSFRDGIQAFATPLAKSAGEDRLTNEDIKRFTSILSDSLMSPTDVNERKMRDLLLTFKDKGADISTIQETFKKAGGSLANVSNLIDSFESDVKKSGANIDTKSSNKGIGNKDKYEYRTLPDGKVQRKLKK